MRIAPLLLSAALLAHAQDYHLEKEAAMGRQLAAGFLKNETVLEDDDVAAYVSGIGGRLVSRSEQPSPYTYTFRINADWQDLPPPEASAFPGGYVIVPSRLLLSARDEAELAGALAHAIIHIAAHHGIPLGQLGRQAPIPLIFLGTFGPRQNTPLLLPVGLLQAQRFDESEADLMAVKLLSNAGYDPEGLARYIGRVQQDPARPEFSQVPPREERLRAIERVIAELPKRTYTASEDFGRIQDEVRRLARPPAPLQAPSLVK